MPKLWIDTETFSPVPIKHGVHRYAEEVEVMLFAWALDDGPVRVEDWANGYNWPTELSQAWGDPGVEVWATTAISTARSSDGHRCTCAPR